MVSPSSSSYTHSSDDVDGIIAQARIEFAASQQQTTTSQGRGFAYPKDSPTVWVKWGYYPRLLQAEACTQDYIHENLDRLDKSIRKGVRVPEVFRFIEAELEDGWSAGLIVMEYIPGQTMASLVMEADWDQGRSDLYRERILDALNAFLSIQSEKGTVPGPEGGGLIQHFVFGRDDSTATQYFQTLEELQGWVNEEVRNVRRHPQTSKLVADTHSQSHMDSPLGPADFTTEALNLCYCDLNLNNFIIPDPSDASLPFYVIDFEHTSWLMFSFLVWELRNKSYGFKEMKLSERSGLSISMKNIHTLSTMGMIIQNR